MNREHFEKLQIPAKTRKMVVPQSTKDKLTKWYPNSITDKPLPGVFGGIEIIGNRYLLDNSVAFLDEEDRIIGIIKNIGEEDGN